MSLAATNPTARLFGHRPFLLFASGRVFSDLASQIATVAVGWQVYDMTRSAFDLGLTGLFQFLPTAILVFIAGHAADRYDRQRVVQACQLLQGTVAVFLAWGTFGGWLTVPWIFAAMGVFGVATAFRSPAQSALLAGVSPEGLVQRASAVSNGSFQTAIITGPMIGGLTYVVSPGAPYVLMAVFWLLASILNGLIKLDRPVAAKDPPTFADLFAGVGFVRNNLAILGTISLDLFAVLLGGATALLPIYAREILETGPWGLGALRSAPAIGALLMTVFLTRHGVNRKIGIRMFQSVIVFGVATVVFALSPWILLSLVALAVMGAADTVSVVIRITLVQVATPDNMRGRVGAVNFLFVNASNQLGEFESGVTAALLGAMPAALLGGIGTILVALLWMKLFPELRKADRLE